MACDYRDRVLEYLRGNTEDPEVEKHLEECGECRALVEGYLEKGKELDIPEAGYGGTDEGLKERVAAAADCFLKMADSRGISLKLRKKPKKA